MPGTPRFPNGTGNSPLVWNPTPSPVPLVRGTVRAGSWVLVQLSYRNTNTLPVAVSTGVAPNVTGFFAAHVLVTPLTDDSMPQKEGGRLQPTMYGGSATKQATSYHVDPGWTFQVPWDSNLSIVSGGVSDESVLVDVVVKVGMTPEMLVEGPSFQESMMYGGHVATNTRSQRVYAPPVVGQPELVPATYMSTVPFNVATDGLATIPFPPGASGMQVTDDVAITPTPTYMVFATMGSIWGMGLQPGEIEQLGSLTQGGGSTDAAPARWGADNLSTVYKVVIWSRLGC